MSNPEFKFKQPSILMQLAETLRLRDISPDDIVPPGQVNALLIEYPDLAGDAEIGRSDSNGRCQSWCDNPGWWKPFIRTR